jgi:phenylalanyl-tRNA synthetase beta chain
MNVSRRWLEAFLRRPLEAQDLVPRLAMLGLPPDGVEPLHAGLAPVVVGLVAELVPHPNADRLKICQVDIGGGQRRQVVTGASNVALGKRYPFAPLGVTLPNGLTLEKRKLRGEVSEGMLCSPDEIGLGSEHDGLMTLEVDAAPGTSILEVLGLGDDRLVLDISPVRGDLLGHKGVARELAASFKIPFRLPEVPGVDGLTAPTVRRTEAASGTLSTGLTIGIEPGTSCQRFTAAVIEGVTIGPSPAWLVRRLESVGQRSISNVVDVTNYVMLELGQPLHAFDGATLRGGWLGARLARPGERLTTLDGTDRPLPAEATVVADGAEAVAVAGIMGGLASEVTATTTTVVIEAAWWEPAATRRTRKAMNLATEASQRFERGTDLWALPDALRRAIEVLVATAGGHLVDAIDVWPTPSNPPRIFLRQRRVAQIVGLDLPLQTIEQTLVAIGATVIPKPDDGRLAVDVPGWRRDLVAEIDLVEEVGRIYGYDKLPDTLGPFRPGHLADAPEDVVARDLRRAMTAEGLFEVVSLSLGPSGGEAAVAVLNPLSADHGYLRERLLPGLTRHVESNWAAQVRDVRLFEIGTVFRRAPDGGRPIETTRLAGVVTGTRAPLHWTDGGAGAEVDRWDLKGLFERAVSLANPAARIQVEGGQLVAAAEGGVVGRAGPIEADRPPWAAPLFGFEVDVAIGVRGAGRFVPQPSLPAASRDLALVIPWSVSADRVAAEMARAVGGQLLEAVAVVDEYRGAGLPADTRSVAFRLTFRGRDRTLKDNEIDHAVSRIQAGLEKQLGVTLRKS